MLRNFFLYLLLILNLILGYRLFFSDQSVFAYLELKQNYEEIQNKLQVTQHTNQELSYQIRLLKSDRIYQEKVIRQHLNYAKEKEMMYIFPERVMPATGAQDNADQN